MEQRELVPVPVKREPKKQPVVRHVEEPPPDWRPEPIPRRWMV